MTARQHRRSRTRKRRAAAGRAPGTDPVSAAAAAADPQASATARGPQASAPGRGPQARAPGRGPQARAKRGGSAQHEWREAVTDARSGARARDRGPAARDRGPAKPQRPPSPWHPLPLSEILILAGALGFVIGLRRGVNTGGRVPLLLGVVVVAVGTIEVCLREHRSGFRSHSILLALLPVVIFHTLTVLVITAFVRVSPAVNLGLVVVDVVLFALLFRLLRVHYGEARFRTLTGARRARS